MRILKFKKVFVWVVILAMVLSALSMAFADEVNPVKVNEKSEEEIYEENLEFLKLVVEFTKDNYLYDLTYDEIIEGLYEGFFNKLDRHSVYYSPEEYSSFKETMSGEFEGIGIKIVKEEDYVVIITPLKDSPAQMAGLKAKDKIISVDGQDIKGFSTEEAAELIKGEVGTSVRLGVLRGEKELYFNVQRDVVTISSVNSKNLKDDIGYLEITQFNENTLELFGDEIGRFDREGIHKLVIDLRNNPGGSLPEVINMLTFFVPRGPIAHIEYANGETEEYESHLDVTTFDLAVIVNEGSASASEIFAGAIQDREAGTIIGTQTYGKGTVQTLYPLRNGSGIKFTTAEYFTANKNKVQDIGITPDIIIENTYETIDISNIPELTKYRKPKLGIVGLDVLASEMILNLLNYDVTGPDGIFDETLERELMKYQRDKGLYPSGILDYTTQETLTQSLTNYTEDDKVDKQLEKAIEVLR